MNISEIAFIDIEGLIESSEHKFGVLYNLQKYKNSSASFIKKVVQESEPKYFCGHNFLHHDYEIIQKYSLKQFVPRDKIIDTLYLSMLLHPGKRSHKLDKPYKSEIFIDNEPAADCEQTKELLLTFEEQYKRLPPFLQSSFYNNLKDHIEFKAFFEAIEYKDSNNGSVLDILSENSHLNKEDLEKIIRDYPVESAILCSLIYTGEEQSISRIILIHYPDLPKLREKIFFDKTKTGQLVTEFAEKEFGFSTFREFSSVDQGLFSISQKSLIESAVKGESFLCVLPTGGGKTFTFQLPAIIKAESCKTLTVVISPLQALMKNHTDNFNSQIKNFKSAALSGFLDPISRLNTLEEIRNGSIDILYLAPEALRSNVVFTVLQSRVIERFVIDEAHCFSAWGHDFRHDYYYIGQCISELQQSPYQTKIAVSCFTATARPNVLEDIIKYFKDFIDIKLQKYIASAERFNLKYKAETVENEKDKYFKLIQIIMDFHDKPMIIYRPQNARGCKKLAQALQEDEKLSSYNLVIEPFYSRIDDDESYTSPWGRTKNQILDDFINNDINIVIATTAFGMGIDKPDIQAVIHYDPSDSLEAYMQESGRGARSSDIEAECIVLYSEKDFMRIFQNQNRSKIQFEEIDRIARFLKKNKKRNFQVSTRSIAGNIGMDTEDTGTDYDNIIKTAILEMEKWDIIKRSRNHTRIYATSIISDYKDNEKSTMELVHEKLDHKKTEYQNYYEMMILLMQNIIQKSKNDPVEIEELAEILGISKKDIYTVILYLQKERLLDYHNDISVLIDDKLLDKLNAHFYLEETILARLKDKSELHKLDIREFNEGIKSGKTRIKLVTRIINSWKDIGHLKHEKLKIQIYNTICSFHLTEEEFRILNGWIQVRKQVCSVIAEYCLSKTEKPEDEIEFSSNSLYELICDKCSINLEFYHHSMAYLNESLDDFNISKGRLIYYQGINLKKTDVLEERTNPYHKIEYKNSLQMHYNLKTEAVHILLHFFKNLEEKGWEEQKEFIKDYFSLDYNLFKKKHNLNSDIFNLPITQSGYDKIVGGLNHEQQEIINDKDSQAILVLAGPGSGKTKTLVHKIASLITIEKNKSEYFLMLTHSRVAAKEFKERLVDLLGATAGSVEIFTFHAYASRIVGRIIKNEEDLENLIPKAIEIVNSSEYKPGFKTMLVLDEFQDINRQMYDFIKAIYERMNKNKRIIAVGDDDQCINNFRKNSADPAFMNKFLEDYKVKNDDSDDFISNDTIPVKTYSLLKNYRSSKNLIEFSNAFVMTLPNRKKTENLIPVNNEDGKLSLNEYFTPNISDKSYLSHMADLISDDKSKEIAVLLRTNQDVLTMYSLLKLKGCRVQYITDTSGFHLGQIVELQDFLSDWIDFRNFTLAFNEFEKNYERSLNIELAKSVIKYFIKDYKQKELEEHAITISHYFEEFLYHINKEEFSISSCPITVSTMHKSKGREFETVYTFIDSSKDDFSKRLDYVAMTRAKNNLHIFTAKGLFSNFNSYFNSYELIDQKLYPPKQISFSMDLGDLWLSNTEVQTNIEKARPFTGESIQIKHNEYGEKHLFCLVKNNLTIGKLSKPSNKNHNLNTSGKILEYESKNYSLEEQCEIENIVYWTDSEENDKRYKQVLCRIVMNLKN